MSESASSEPTLPPTVQEAEQVANTVADTVAATGIPDAVIADAALHGAEDVGNAVDVAVQNHGTVLADALAGLQAAVAVAPAVASTVSPAASSKVSSAVNVINPLLAALEALHL